MTRMNSGQITGGKIGAQNISGAPPWAQKNKHSHDPTVCSECGAEVTLETAKHHMVTAHGYLQVGAQVFKRELCEVDGCGKPALHKMGVRRFCGTHKGYAALVATRVMARMDPFHVAMNKMQDGIDKERRATERSREAHGRRNARKK